MPIRSVRHVLTVAAVFCLPAALGGSRAAAGELSPAPPSTPQLARVFEEARTAARIPGLAWAVVRDDAVVSQGGRGVEAVGGAEKVDEATVFAVASLTKAFTSAAVAILVDEGRVSWDDPVVRHLPGFELSDPWVTSHITVRDLLSMRSGLLDADAPSLEDSPSRKAAVERMATAPLRGGFRSTSGTSPNHMYLVAGELVAATSGRTWDDFVRERLFAPLGMTRTSTSHDALLRSGRYARPHRARDGRVEAVPLQNNEIYGGAAAITSTASDLAAWIRLQLARGRLGDRQVISEASIREMHRPQALWGEYWKSLFNPSARIFTYGMGWMVSDVGGELLVEHGGALPGFTALVALLPERRMGFVLLANLDFETAFAPLNALKFELLDRLRRE
jgi:CubicO group peptidase (beta-lactamase class C family)